MIYINGNMVTTDIELTKVEYTLKTYLHNERLVLVNDDGQPFEEKELNRILTDISDAIYLKAVPVSTLLVGFKEELGLYIKKLEDYIEDTRESEDLSTVNSSFVQVVEALLEFAGVTNYLQKDLVNPLGIRNMSEKAFAQAETGNLDYILDLMEYELLPLFHAIINELNEAM